MHHSVLFFSGTGNSQDCVTQIVKTLNRLGHTADVVDLGRPGWKDDYQRAAIPGTRLVLAFPVYAFSPPALVMRAITALPNGEGRPAAVVAVDGGGGYGAAETARRALQRRGFDVHFSARVEYPENWTQFVPPPGPEARDATIGAARLEAERVGSAIAGDAREQYVPGGAAALLGSAVGFLFRVFARRFLGQLFVADDRCTSCGLCERSCPVSAIVMKSGPGERPRWHATCESCNRCINICPERAINTSWFRIAAVPGLIAVLSVVFVRLARIVPFLERGSFPGDGAVVVTGAILLAHVFVFATAPLIFRLEHWKPFRRIGHASFTRGFNRYTLPGFRAPRSR